MGKGGIVIEYQEPEWVSITRLGSNYEEQVDVRSKNSDRRHRRVTFTGEPVGEWKYGPAPD